MRRHRTGLNISALVTPHQRVLDREPDALTQLHVNRDGHKAAAWLVWSQRARFRRTGEVDFRMASVSPTPPWFRVAIECLRQRRGWGVVTFGEKAPGGGSVRVYRVTHHAWAHYQRLRDERWVASS